MLAELDWAAAPIGMCMVQIWALDWLRFWVSHRPGHNIYQHAQTGVRGKLGWSSLQHFRASSGD